MTKLPTREAVALALAEYNSIEFDTLEGNPIAEYYLHVTDDGEIVSSRSEADATFVAKYDFSYLYPEVDAWEPDEDGYWPVIDSMRIYDAETLDNPNFAAVVDELCAAANEYFRGL